MPDIGDAGELLRYSADAADKADAVQAAIRSKHFDTNLAAQEQTPIISMSFTFFTFFIGLFSF